MDSAVVINHGRQKMDLHWNCTQWFKVRSGGAGGEVDRGERAGGKRGGNFSYNRCGVGIGGACIGWLSIAANEFTP
mgnify:CR=1 FL=1